MTYLRYHVCFSWKYNSPSAEIGIEFELLIYSSLRHQSEKLVGTDPRLH